MPSFDPNTYWEQRLGERYTLDGVGCTGLGGALNGWMYRVRRRVFLREMRGRFPRPRDLRVLDIGSGTGFYIERWHELGAGSVAGSDLTEVAVANLRSRFPSGTFERFDVGADTSRSPLRASMPYRRSTSCSTSSTTSGSTTRCAASTRC